MKHLVAFVVPLLVSMWMSACQPQQVQTVSFDELIADPSRYQDQFICTQGVYLSGSEASSLGGSTYEEDGLFYLTQPVIWIEGAAIELEGECSRRQEYSFCPASVCGEFQEDGTFGHLGSFLYQITGSD